MSAPGISIAQVLDNAPAAPLRNLVGQDLVEVLEGVKAAKATDNELRDTAKRLYGNNDPTLIRDNSSREQLIDLLPPEKARELAGKLSISQKGNVYRTLKQVDLRSGRNADTIYQFFGVTEERRAPYLEEPADKIIRTRYGLFVHQRTAVSDVQRQLLEYPHKSVLHMPTGAGKTRTAMHVVAGHLKSSTYTLVVWLANSKELLDQAAEAFEEAWSALGDRDVRLIRLWDNAEPDLSELRDGVIVAGLPKLHAASKKDENLLMRLGDRATLTVVDEAHQAVASTYRKVIEGISTKRPVNQLLGLTATPGRTWSEVDEDRVLAEFFAGKKVTLRVEGYDDPVTYLVEEGYLARPRFRELRMAEGIDITAEEKASLHRGDDVPGTLLNRIGKHIQRNVLIIKEVESLLERHARVLVFSASVQQAQILSGVLSARGHDANVITGETAASQRGRVIRRFQGDSATRMVICNFGVLTAGFDAPKTSAAVIARPTRSLVLYSQMVGRATRGPKANGNNNAEIVTVIDTRLPGFGDLVEAFENWEDVWDDV